jgi:hypothetical protein
VQRLHRKLKFYFGRDQLVDFVAEVRKMDIVPVDEAYIVQNLQADQLEEITYGIYSPVLDRWRTVVILQGSDSDCNLLTVSSSSRHGAVVLTRQW